MIRIIHDAEEKQNIARSVLEALPEWFAVAEAREKYIAESASEIMIASFADGTASGFVCLKETGRDTAELAVMGVRKEYQRQGIGRALFQQAVRQAESMGFSFLQVKTVQEGRYEEYDRTNRFYRSLGFKEFEVFPDYWDKANPCQIYVMHIG